MAGTQGSLGQALDRILALLDRRGYVKGDQLTDAGRMLSRIWSESDLVVAECLQNRIWQGLGPADLAAVTSILVFEARREGVGVPRMSGAAATEAIAATMRVWAEISADEEAEGLPATRTPDLGFAAAVAAWASGETLTQALTVANATGTDMSAGDFVRWCRQVIDLLDQVRTVAPAGVGGHRQARTHRAATGCRRARRGIAGRTLQPGPRRYQVGPAVAPDSGYGRLRRTSPRERSSPRVTHGHPVEVNRRRAWLDQP